MAKSTSDSSWRQRPSGFLASIAALALIVTLVAGAGIGYEIEKGRIKKPVKTAAVRPGARKVVPAKAVRVTGS